MTPATKAPTHPNAQPHQAEPPTDLSQAMPSDRETDQPGRLPHPHHRDQHQPDHKSAAEVRRGSQSRVAQAAGRVGTRIGDEGNRGKGPGS